MRGWETMQEWSICWGSNNNYLCSEKGKDNGERNAGKDGRGKASELLKVNKTLEVLDLSSELINDINISKSI